MPFKPLRRRLQTPQGDRSTMIEPPLEQVRAVVDENVRLEQQRHYDFHGRRLADVSQLARRELLDAARRWTAGYRDVATIPSDPARLIYLAGHQPQMFHPGVWFKNFVLGRLAELHGATAVNLIVDNDVLSDASLRVPTGSMGEPHAVSVPFDASGFAIPYEDRPIHDQPFFEAFADRVAEKMAFLVKDPSIRRYWPSVCARAKETGNVGAAIAQARHQWEASWGLQTLEIPMSRVCRGEAFQWFVAHLLARSASFRDVYNEAIRDYRREHRIRGISHPAPELAEDDDWIEVPLWIWSATQPQRRRLFARSSRGEMILTDRRGWQTRLPLDTQGDASRAIEPLLELQRDGIRIRSRALTTTLWARLVLGDLFMHGIGGAKYDQVTDQIIERFFGFTPPAFVVASATLLLPIERDRATQDDARLVEQQLRELVYHPERFLDGRDQHAAELSDAKRRWIETPQTLENAKQRCRAIRQINEELQPWLAERRRQLYTDQATIRKKLQAEDILASRDFAFCLYPESTLRNFVAAATFLP